MELRAQTAKLWQRFETEGTMGPAAKRQKMGMMESMETVGYEPPNPCSASTTARSTATRAPASPNSPKQISPPNSKANSIRKCPAS